MTNAEQMQKYIQASRSRMTLLLEEIIASCPQEVPLSERNIAREHLGDTLTDLFACAEVAAERADILANTKYERDYKENDALIPNRLGTINMRVQP